MVQLYTDANVYDTMCNVIVTENDHKVQNTVKRNFPEIIGVTTPNAY